MQNRFIQIIKGSALMTETKPKIELDHHLYMSRVLNNALNQAYFKAAQEVGLSPVIPKQAGRGSSDFGNISHIIPGAHVYFSIANKEIPAHSPQFKTAAGSSYGIAQMFKASEAMALVGYRFFTDNIFRKEIQNDFAAQKKDL